MPPLLALNNLDVGFQSARETLFAVRNLDLFIEKGEIACLVGESGCGKSLTCKAILRLVPKNALIGGQVLFENEDMLRIGKKRLCQIRGARIGMIFQEPMTSLNPVLTIGQQTAEPLIVHQHLSRREARKKVIELFNQVGLPDAENRYSVYPHQLSGGMRQRVMIAMALSCGPALLLADEPTTALDATVQGQILRLIVKESRERKMSVLLITHDLGVVADMADSVGVMYAGSLVEWASGRNLFEHPMHPYTRGLMACSPGKDSAGQARLPAIPGVVPALDELPPGCPFQPRCEEALPRCAWENPPYLALQGHKVACWLYDR